MLQYQRTDKKILPTKEKELITILQSEKINCLKNGGLMEVRQQEWELADDVHYRV